MAKSDDDPTTTRVPIREHNDVWEAFGAVAERATGVTGRGAKAEFFRQAIRDAFAKYGTPDERATLARADAEMEERRRNRGRRGLAGRDT